MPTLRAQGCVMDCSDTPVHELTDFSIAFAMKFQDVSMGRELGLRRCFDLQCRFGGYRSCDSVTKTWVSSRGICSWPDNSYGIAWVAMHGMGDSICVVIRHKDLDMTRTGPIYKYLPEDLVMYGLTTSVVSQIEELPDELSERYGQFIENPFGVVSVNEESGQEASSAVYDVEKAINFLRKKMKSDSAFTLNETIQTAISAFQHMCLEELKAEDICVYVCQDSQVATYTLTSNKIEEHLALIKI